MQSGQNAGCGNLKPVGQRAASVLQVLGIRTCITNEDTEERDGAVSGLKESLGCICKCRFVFSVLASEEDPFE